MVLYGRSSGSDAAVFFAMNHSVALVNWRLATVWRKDRRAKSRRIYAAAFGFLLNSKPGATIMADDNIERIPIKDIRQEEGAHELASSPDMKPYLEFIKAVMQDHDPSPELEAIRHLPLERRYIWRIASALK